MARGLIPGLNLRKIVGPWFFDWPVNCSIYHCTKKKSSLPGNEP
jgi:hypothetical protein